MSDTKEWSARKILTELCSSDKKREVLASFWKDGDPGMQASALIHLSKALHFREGSLRKAPSEKKADLLASRMNQPELQEALEAALMIYHTRDQKEMMSALLDLWSIPHKEGSIEVDEYPVPSADQVRQAVAPVAERFGQPALLLYLATAGLLMGGVQPEWRAATWPVVDELRTSGESAGRTAPKSS